MDTLAGPRTRFASALTDTPPRRRRGAKNVLAWNTDPTEVVAQTCGEAGALVTRPSGHYVHDL